MKILKMDDVDALIKYLRNIDDDFIPRLSTKICFSDFSHKIINLGVVMAEVRNNNIIGIVAFYCNNIVEKQAYVTLCAVDSEYRGRGIAKHLLLNAVEYVRGKKFNKIGIHSNNPLAIEIYKKIGFNIILNEPSRTYLEYNLNEL